MLRLCERRPSRFQHARLSSRNTLRRYWDGMSESPRKACRCSPPRSSLARASSKWRISRRSAMAIRRVFNNGRRNWGIIRRPRNPSGETRRPAAMGPKDATPRPATRRPFFRSLRSTMSRRSEASRHRSNLSADDLSPVGAPSVMLLQKPRNGSIDRRHQASRGRTQSYLLWGPVGYAVRNRHTRRIEFGRMLGWLRKGRLLGLVRS